MPRIFGREPVAWVGLIEAAVALLVVFQLGLSAENAANIVAVVAAGLGVYTAYATRDTMLGVVTGLAKALIALAVGYGLEFTAEQTGAILAVVAVVVGFFQRTQTSPVNGEPVELTPAEGL